MRLDVEFPIGAGDLEFFEICIAVENFLMVRDSVVLYPDIGVVEAVGEATDMSLPVANEKVEVVRGIALRKICGIGSRLGRLYWFSSQATLQRFGRQR